VSVIAGPSLSHFSIWDQYVLTFGVNRLVMYPNVFVLILDMEVRAVPFYFMKYRSVAPP
jgi:hypothetical protein